MADAQEQDIVFAELDGIWDLYSAYLEVSEIALTAVADVSPSDAEPEHRESGYTPMGIVLLSRH